MSVSSIQDQRMKGQGNQVSNVPKDHIESGEDFESWRQQQGNHGPSYVSMSTNDPYNAAGYYSSTAGAQFQYPPFGVGDGTWSSGNENLAILGGYATHENYGVDGMFGPTFGQPSTYNYFPGNGDYNTWGSQQLNAAAAQQQSRKGIHYDDYYRGDPAHDGLKSVEQGMQGLGLEVGSTLQDKEISNNTNAANSTNSIVSKHDQPKEIIPKKMTWATIASQPAKPQTTSTTSTIKKKGPGMPPPPMVPGKHNMDIGTWDSPSKNGPSMLVPPPLPLPPPPIMQSSLPPLIPPSVSSAPSTNIVVGVISNTNSNNNNIPLTNNNQNNKINAVPVQQPPPAATITPAMVQHPPPPPSQQQPTSLGSNGGIAIQQQQSQQHNTHGRSSQPINMRPQWPHERNSSYQQNNHMMHQSSTSMQQPLHQQRSMAPGHHNSSSMKPSGVIAGSLSSSVGGVSSGNGGNYQGQPTQLQLQLSQQNQQQQRMLQSPVSNCSSSSSHIILDSLKDKNNYNPDELDLDRAVSARFFVIKSYSEDDIHRSIKYEIWCSTEHGNKRLDQAFKEREKESGLIYLLFSVNGSGHFCGVAQMISSVDYNSNSTVWSQNKWKGTFKVKWIYVKDVPNTHLRHIRLENNDNKSVTNSRDTQEVLNGKGVQVMRIVHAYKHTTSIFDDFIHYEKRQELEDSRKVETLTPQQHGPRSLIHHNTGERGDRGERSHDKYNNDMKSHGYDKNNHGPGSGSSYEKHSYGSGKSYGYETRNQYNHHGGERGGGYHGYDNRRDDRNSYDRGLKDHDGGSGGYYPRDDYHRNQRGGNTGSNRGDFRDNRREDRGGYHNLRDRDRDNNHDIGGPYNIRGGDSGVGRGGGDRGGGHRDHHRERGDHHNNIRGSGSSSAGRGRGGGSIGGNRN